MKKRILSVISFCTLIGLSGCNSFLELESLEKVSGSQLTQSSEGLKTLLAKVYNSIPMEDFAFRPIQGFNQRGWSGVDYMSCLSFYTDEATRSDGDQGLGPGQAVAAWDFSYWPYGEIRQVNLFLENVEAARQAGNISDDEAACLLSEGHFVRAYIYFGLAKRYGGVPLVTEPLDDEYVPGSANESLYIQRSTESDTYRFILDECDLAIAHLPVKPADTYRASKWAAYGLKSRVALFAASLAKYANRVSIQGDAVTQKLAFGMDPSEASYFYGVCCDASKAIIDNSGKSLYMPNPSSPEEAATNYQNLFLTNNEEIIFSKAYLDGTVVANQGHSFDIYYSPSQANPGYHKFGRYNPTLNIVDLYEDYTDDGTGKSAPIVTRTDQVENEYLVNVKNGFDAQIPFKQYDNLYEPFAGKDARLLASIIVPGATYKGTTIIMQGGMIKADGTTSVYSVDSDTKNGVTYYAFGAQGSTNYSGFDGMGKSDDGNFSTTGFSIRKFLQESKNISGVENSSTTSWIDMRLAEFYLNYAEAVVESGEGDRDLAAKYMNDLRHRAAHKDDIPLTLENVLKERQVEMAFEGQHYWDLVRRREYHQLFNASSRKVLVPMIDLYHGDTPKYIFVRANYYYDEYNGGRTFEVFRYYKSIPGRNTNNLVQNPNY